METVSECQSSVTPCDWQCRMDGPATGAQNMTVDQQLLEAQKKTDALPVFRVFSWAHTTLSYGRLQPRDQVNAWAEAQQVAEIVQRPTGGGMVRHDQDISFALAWRRDHPAFPKCLKNIYQAIHQAVQHVLIKEGIETTLAPAPQKRGLPGVCFVEPAENDVLFEGKKIVGGALRVTSWGRLYQGNIIWDTFSTDKSTFSQKLVAGFQSTFFQKSPSAFD